MPDESSNFNTLKSKLRELFELDKSDLDFGIYRILRQRHREISEFLDKHLKASVAAAIATHGEAQSDHLEQDLTKAETAAKAAGISPEQSPRVLELRAKLENKGDGDSIANEVYSHLLTFFSRYYQEGDFLGLRRATVRGHEKYMAPYNGEEVKLFWANMDQYYIKSSDLLRDYAFEIRKAQLRQLHLGSLPDVVRVQFKLVEGDTEKDNRKPDPKMARAFGLDTEHPFEEEGDSLVIRFVYKEFQIDRRLQEKLNSDTEKSLADTLPANWKTLLFATTARSEAQETDATILQAHLRQFTAKYEFDYFIHRDLGDFLRRELDFYIKNEVMHIDDIEKTEAPQAAEYLSKLRAIRTCALPIIRMLGQLEDFQKKLWLKKKFVVETRYCLTIDRLPSALLAEVCANDAQWEEWNSLYDLGGLAPKRTAAFLKANPYLMVDTRHFSREFTLELLKSIDNIDEKVDGLCIQSENFQALRLIQDRYQEQAQCIYIDPPYNTDASEILYKNNYKSSSWMTLIDQSLPLGKRLLADDGVLCGTIDDEQQKEFSSLLSTHFSAENVLGTVAIRINPSGRVTLRGFAQAHEYAIFVGRSDDSVIAKLPRTEEQQERFDQADQAGDFEWRNFRREGSSSERSARPKRFFPLYVSGCNVRVPKLEWIEAERAYKVLEEPGLSEEVIYPIDSQGGERVWRWGLKRIALELKEIVPKKKANGQLQVYYKYRPNAAGVLPLTVWADKKYSATEYGTAVLKKLFGDRNVFDFPKSIHAVTDCLRVAGALRGDALVIDYFGGSGTTGHAVIDLNREDSGNRKYVLVEMGKHADSVLIPRLKKVAYATEWNEGKPLNRDTGISHLLKVIRLESYEDTLNNLRLVRTEDQTGVLSRAADSVRDDYLMGYFLTVESAGSASLLDIDAFRDPFSYKLKIASSSAGETKEMNVDLPETFNWLLGIKIGQIDSSKGFLTVRGETHEGGRLLIVWRKLSGDSIADNVLLEKFLAKLQVNPADTEFAAIYVNGPHTLSDPHNKIHLIEETFKRLMFDDSDFPSLL
jgi:adenine-specific DNA-methyltransferase